jgi:tetratricopeptide (TPR) repeat protein
VRARAISIVLLLASATAVAAPKKKSARAQFDRGVAAYTKGDYAAAIDALGKSFALEADEETLFAWAQSERKLGHCDKAIELYTKLLAMNLPAENKEAVKVQLGECKQILDEERAAAAMLDSSPAPPSGPAETPGAGPVDPPTPSPSPSSSPSPSPSSSPSPSPSPITPVDTTRPRWKDPVGLSLLGAGALGIVVGTVFLVKGSSAQSDADNANDYDDFITASDRADSDGRIGVVSLVAGGAFVTAGIVWYVTRAPSSPDRTVSGWLAPSGGGLAVSGRF